MPDTPPPDDLPAKVQPPDPAEVLRKFNLYREEAQRWRAAHPPKPRGSRFTIPRQVKCAALYRERNPWLTEAQSLSVALQRMSVVMVDDRDRMKVELSGQVLWIEDGTLVIQWEDGTKVTSLDT